MGNNTSDNIETQDINIQQLQKIKIKNVEYYRKNEQNQSLNNIEQSHYVKLLDINEEQQIIIKEFIFTEEIEFKQKKEVLKNLKQLDSMGIVQILQIIDRSASNLCSNSYKLQTVFQINSSKTLSEEINERINNNLVYYSELELIHLLECLLSSLQTLDQIQRALSSSNLNTLFQYYHPSQIIYDNTYRIKPSILNYDDTLTNYQKQLQYKQVYKNSQKFLSKLGFFSPSLLKSFNNEVYCPEYNKLIKNEVFSIGMTVLSTMLLQPDLQQKIYQVKNNNSLVLDQGLLDQLLRQNQFYSEQFINLLQIMLNEDDDLRPDPNSLFIKINHLKYLISSSQNKSNEIQTIFSQNNVSSQSISIKQNTDVNSNLQSAKNYKKIFTQNNNNDYIKKQYQPTIV